jgi:thioredoxin reductase
VNVSSIDKQGDFFIVKTKDKVFKSYALLIATGAIHRNLEVKG